MIDKSDEAPPVRRPVGAVLSLLSRMGPEVPPDFANAPPVRHPGEEPTQTLPVIVARKPPAPGVAARAVIVYETQPRRPWVLWMFTAMLVALTIGVVLGQTAV